MVEVREEVMHELDNLGKLGGFFLSSKISHYKHFTIPKPQYTVSIRVISTFMKVMSRHPVSE